MKLTPDRTKVDARYLYFVFTSADVKHYLQSNAVVTGVPHINLRLLRDYSLSLPPLAEQEAIAAVLGALDDKTELNQPDRGSYFLALNPPASRVASTGFAVLSPTTAPWSYIHAALTQSAVSDHLGQMADGGAYPAVRPEIIGAMKVAQPSERFSTLFTASAHRSLNKPRPTATNRAPSQPSATHCCRSC